MKGKGPDGTPCTGGTCYCGSDPPCWDKASAQVKSLVKDIKKLLRQLVKNDTRDCDCQGTFGHYDGCRGEQAEKLLKRMKDLKL